MGQIITSLKHLPIEKRGVRHLRKYCAHDGARAEFHFDTPEGQYCVNCPSGLNEAGNRMMREKYHDKTEE